MVTTILSVVALELLLVPLSWQLSNGSVERMWFPGLSPFLYLMACSLFFMGAKPVSTSWNWRLALLPNGLGAALATQLTLSAFPLLALPLALLGFAAPRYLFCWGFFLALYAVTFDFTPRDKRKNMGFEFAFIFLNGLLLVFSPQWGREVPGAEFSPLVYPSCWAVIFCFGPFLLAPLWKGVTAWIFGFAIGGVLLLTVPVGKELFAPLGLNTASVFCGILGTLLLALKCRNFIRAKGATQPTQAETTRDERTKERPVTFLKANARLFHWRFGRMKRQRIMLIAVCGSLPAIALGLILSKRDAFTDQFAMFLAVYALFSVNVGVAGKVAEGLGDLRWQSLFPRGRGRFLKEYYGTLAVDLFGPNLLMALLALLALPFPACRGVVTLFVVNLCVQPLLLGAVVLIVSFIPGKRFHGMAWFGLLFVAAAALLAFALPQGGLPPKDLALCGAPLALLGFGAGVFMAWLAHRRLMNADL